MLNKKSVRIISIILLAIVMLTVVSNVAFAAISVPEPNDGITVDAKLSTAIGKALGFIQYGGLVAAVAVAMFIGIKYITSSPEGKAEVKKTIGFYVAGIVILLSASLIVTTIKSNLVV